MPSQVFKGELDSYTIQEELTAGKNGYVYRAIAEKTSQSVVVKRPNPFRPDGAPSELLSKHNEGLERERKALKMLENVPEIAHYIDTGFCNKSDQERELELDTIHFNVTEFIDGITLGKWCKKYAQSTGEENFTGIREPRLWFALATSLIDVLAEVHARKVVHGDLFFNNIMVRKAEQSQNTLDWNQIVLIDFGQGIDYQKQFDARADRNKWHPHTAPERVNFAGAYRRWYSPADIYSLGNALLFLAVGNLDLIPFRPEYVIGRVPNSSGYRINANRINASSNDCFKSYKEIKNEIIQAFQGKNEILYQKFPALVEIISFCIRPEVAFRAKNAAEVGQQLRAVAPSLAGKKYLDTSELGGIVKQCQGVLDSINAQQVPIILSRLVLNDFERLVHGLKRDGQRTTKLLERRGRRDELVLDLTSCIGEMKSGTIQGVIAVALIHELNLAPDELFIASLATAAQSNVQAQLVILADQNKKEHKEIVRICSIEVKRRLNVLGKVDSKFDERFQIKYYYCTSDTYEKFIAEHGSLLVLRPPGNSVIAVDADYTNTGGECTGLRFSERPLNSILIENFDKQFGNYFNVARSFKDVT